MKTYPVPREQIMFGDVNEQLDTPTRQARRRCASGKQKYAWMRFDTCVELPRGGVGRQYPVITSSRDVSRLLHEAVPFAGRNREFFVVLCLDAKNKPIAIANPHTGGRDNAAVDPSTVLQAVVLSGAIGYIVAHNHPSGDATPSEADVEMTRRLKQASEYLGVSLLDHIVLTDDPTVYTSFLDRGLMSR